MIGCAHLTEEANVSSLHIPYNEEANVSSILRKSERLFYPSQSVFSAAKSGMSNRIPEKSSESEDLLIRKHYERRFEFQHILDSFNWFTRIGLPKLLHSRKFPLSGGRVSYLKFIRYESPRFYDMGKSYPLYPEIAMLQGATYQIDVFVKVVIEQLATSEVLSESAEFILMTLPILVYSEHCHRAKELEKNVHPRDPGCYLIINGKRYVVLLYEKARMHMCTLGVNPEKNKHSLPYVYQLIDTPVGTSCTYIYMTPDSKGSFALGVKVSRYVPSKDRIHNAKETEEKKKKVPIAEKLVNVLTLAYVILSYSDNSVKKDDVLQMFSDTLRNVIPREQFYDCIVLFARTEQEYEEMAVDDMMSTVYQKLDIKEGEIKDKIVKEHIRDSIFSDKKDARSKVGMLMTLTARLLQCKCGFVAVTNPHHWGTRGLFGSGAIMYETLRGKLAMLYDKIIAHSGFENIREAVKIYDLVNEIGLGNKFLNDLRAIKPKNAAKQKMTAGKMHGDEKSSVMLAEILNTKDLRAMLTKHRNNVDANSPDIRHRAVQGSFFPMMDYLKATEGKQCGSTKFIAQHTSTTLETSASSLTLKLLRWFPPKSPEVRVVRKEKSDLFHIPVFVNGPHLIGYTDSNGCANVVMLKRFGIIDRYCSVVYQESVGALEIFCDANRLVAPVVVVDPTTHLPAMFGPTGKSDQWRSLSFEGLLRKGYVMYLDGNEIENIGVRIAETFATFQNHRADTAFVASILADAQNSGDKVTIANATLQLSLMEKHWPTYALLHPLMALSITCSTVSLIDKLQSCRVAYTEKMENQKMGAFLDDPNAHVDRLIPMFQTRSRIVSRVAELVGLPEEPSGKTVTIALFPHKMNQEDAFIMSSPLADLGKFHYVNTIVITETLEADEEFRSMNVGKESSYHWRYINEKGMPTAGVLLSPGDYIIGKCRVTKLPDGKEKRVSMSRKLDDDEYGYVREVVTFRSAIAGGQHPGKKTVSILLQMVNPPQVGDKSAAASVQKHILSAKIPEADMLWDDRGVAVDAGMNPMSIPTRMDIATLLRPLLGIEMAMTGKMQDTQGFKLFNMAETYRTLHSHGFQSTGVRGVRSGITGERVHSQILVGPGRLAALARIGEQQFQCRGLGKTHSVTRQAVASKSTNADKGQKWGHFESTHTATYGAPSVTFDRMNACCDGVTIVACRFCSYYATYSPEETRFECKNCDTTGKDQFGLFDMSQTFTYLTACLQSMGVRPRPVFVTAPEYLSRKDIMAEVKAAGLDGGHVEDLMRQLQGEGLD